MTKVSVLVAVHDASPYLPQCLDSLTGQTLSDLQIICVDDASTDNSLTILNDYQRRDPRIEVVSVRKNVGMAHARNIALRQAKGAYVCMLDADDWYAPDALQQAVDVFERHPRTDCVLFRFVLAYKTETGFTYEDFPSANFTVISGEEACRMSLTWQVHGIYMVRTDIHQRYPYDTTCKLYSDENTTRLHYAVSREVRCCRGIYYYRQHAQSETHRITVRRFDRLRAKESLMQQLTAADVAFDVQKILTNQLWLDTVDLYMFYFVHGRELSLEDRRYGLSELHRVWQTIDRSQLSPRLRRKFGYCPMPTWQLFRLQEWCYFTLRGLFHKNY